jgi:hypothetical protein
VRRSIIAASALLCVVLSAVGSIALAQTITPPPVARTFKPPAKSPVTFVRVRSGQGFSRPLPKGTPLKGGQTVELVIGKGNVVVPPGDCACQGLGLVQPKGQKLASVFVQVRTASGKLLATAPAKGLFIEGNGSGGLPVGFTYEFARGTKRFPKGSALLIYGFFSRS